MTKTNWRETLQLWAFTILKVPMIFWVRPRVVTLTPQQAVIRIPFNRSTKNHLRSMYFGVLCVGADVTGGIHLMFLLRKELAKISFVFKDFQADFLKRPEADVVFTCNDGDVIARTIEKALQTKNRENATVNVVATTPSLSADEPVARFTLTLSVKEKPTKNHTN